MTRNSTTGETVSLAPRPWYREPWPWVAIAIPGLAVIAGLFTLYLAISNPDPLVVDEQSYRDLRSELRAEPETRATDKDSGQDRHDGDG